MRRRAGATLVHFSAQPKLSVTECTESTHRIPQKVLRVSRKVDECKSLSEGRAVEGAAALARAREAVPSCFLLHFAAADLEEARGAAVAAGAAHFSAQPEPSLSLLPLVHFSDQPTSLSSLKRTQRASQKRPTVLNSSRKVDQCKSLGGGQSGVRIAHGTTRAVRGGGSRGEGGHGGGGRLRLPPTPLYEHLSCANRVHTGLVT